MDREGDVPEKSLLNALQENVRFIARALSRIEAAENGETGLRNVRVYLLNTLELIEPDHRITQASDELYHCASLCVEEQEREVLLEGEPRVSPRLVQAANDALMRFEDALSSARPNEQALRLGLR